MRLTTSACALLAVVLAACAKHASSPRAPASSIAPKASTHSTNDPALAALTSDPVLAKIHFLSHSYRGAALWVATPLEAAEAEALRVRARTHTAESGLFPLLVPADVLPSTAAEWSEAASEERDEVPSEAAFSVDAFLADRAADLANESTIPKTLAALSSTKPGAPYFEGLDYVHEPAEKLALVLVRAEPWEVATIFLEEEGSFIPSPGPLASMLRRWHARYGVEPAYIGGRFYMELTTTSRPKDDAELRALAREFLLTCPSDYEAFAREPASRLLARLRGERWICWWFVE